MNSSPVVSALMIGLLIGTAAAQEVVVARHSQPTITVVGRGEASGTPDMAQIQIGVVTQAESAGAALEANNHAMTDLLASLKARGIEPKDIQTTSFNVSPMYRQDRSGPQAPRIVGYQVVNDAQVKVRNLSILGAVLDEVVQKGANRINGISFGISNPEPLLDDARRKAMSDARHRAELFASAAGVQVGPPLRIEEQGVYPIPVPQYQMRAAEAAAVPIEAGQQTLSASVTVTYALLEAQ